MFLPKFMPQTETQTKWSLNEKQKQWEKGIKIPEEGIRVKQRITLIMKTYMLQ